MENGIEKNFDGLTKNIDNLNSNGTNYPELKRDIDALDVLIPSLFDHSAVYSVGKEIDPIKIQTPLLTNLNADKWLLGNNTPADIQKLYTAAF